MIKFLKKYKAFFIGLIVTKVLALILEYKGVILIDEDEHLSNILGFLFYWFLISILIHKIPYLKEHFRTVIKIISLLLFLVVILVIDSNANMPDNPITIILFIVFYLAVVYVITPAFFRKYKVAILFTYALAYSVFLYFRLFSDSFELYRQQSKELLILFLLPIPIFASLWAYQQWKWFQNLKSEKSKAELAMLQAQMNPHFFFNTLNNLYALTIKNSQKAPEVILKLSDMMRYTIYEGEKELVTLKDEIEYLRNYIELHKIRYKKSVDIQFEKDIDTRLQVAPLLFIILLENAFKHGIETLTENAYIHMHLKEDEEYIYFEIENNFDPKEVSSSNGIGLQNLQKRLSLLYPKKHKLVIDKTINTYKTTLKILKHA